MRTICIYCGVLIKAGSSLKTSHGCCNRCLPVKAKEFGLNKKQIQELIKERNQGE